MRYLGLDVGQKNIGVAVGEVLAEELTTIRSNGDGTFYDENKNTAIEELIKLAKKEEAKGFVVGLPVDNDGKMTSEAEKIEEFAKTLERESQLKIEFVNETLTSFMAADILESQGVKKDKIKQRIDQLAAKLILQQFLEEHAVF